MIPQLKFRGKSIDMGNWIIGYGVVVTETDAVIIHKQASNLMQHTAVLTQSVGRFTGVIDKNGAEVYEGDILDFDEKEWGAPNFMNAVEWDEKHACFDFGGGTISDVPVWRKIIGNIHDNTELLQTA